MSLQIVTANRLRDGLVVFHATSGWTERYEDAALLDAEAAAAVVAAADPTLVVGVYALDVDQARELSKVRERIRIKGPTVRPDLGKQAEA